MNFLQHTILIHNSPIVYPIKEKQDFVIYNPVDANLVISLDNKFWTLIANFI